MKRPLWWPHLNIWELKSGRRTFFGWWTTWVIEERWLEYQYTKLGRQKVGYPTLADRLLQSIKNRCLEYHYTKLGRQTYFGQWTPLSQLRIDALNTTTPNLADKPTLADGPHCIIEERLLQYQYTELGRWAYFGKRTPWGIEEKMTWIPVHKTWQMNIHWPDGPPVNWE